jgi:hypothetical protein
MRHTGADEPRREAVMHYEIICEICKCTIWIRGIEEYDTNALVLDDNDPAWDEACEHIANGDYRIGVSESIDSE